MRSAADRWARLLAPQRPAAAGWIQRRRESRSRTHLVGGLAEPVELITGQPACARLPLSDDKLCTAQNDQDVGGCVSIAGREMDTALDGDAAKAEAD